MIKKGKTKMDFEKVKSELLEIDSRFRIERPDEDTIHICYDTLMTR